MHRKQTLNKKIDSFFEGVFWISYIMIILLTPLIAIAVFIGGLFVTFAG